jgi:hypothetical protein
VHRRLGEQVSETLVFAILHWEKTNKIFEKHSSRDCSQILHDGSSSEGCIGTPSSSSPGSRDRQRERSTAAHRGHRLRSIVSTICISTTVNYIYSRQVLFS